MDFLAVAWLPVLLSAVFVFIVSSIFHMALGYHKAEYKKLDGETEMLEAMRKHTIPTGEYAFPAPSSMKDLSNPEMIKKWEQGPVGYMTVIPSRTPSMGKNLVLWFLYSIVIGLFAAYLAAFVLGREGSYLAVFRITGTVAVLGYAVTHIPDSIWKGRPWKTTFWHIFDGVIYGLLTAGTFGWLWPRV